MPSILLTPPAVEPLTLDEAKSYLRIDAADEDATVTALIAAARLHVEGLTRRALITQTWRLSLDAWPDDGRIPVRPGPLRLLDAARVYDLDNVAHALDTQSFVPDLAASALNVMPWSLAQPQRAAAGIELDVVCGYGDASSDVPEPLRQAIRLLTAHWYDNRGLVAPGATLAALPASVAALIAPYRMVSL
jgi:uncharacterized phiE125 gp8 family phage protein